MGKLIVENNSLSKNKNYYDYKKIKSMHTSVPNSSSIHRDDFSDILNLKEKIKEIDDFFYDFYNNTKNTKRGIFIYGKSGSGKTRFIKDYLINKKYDPIFYEPHEQRNKNSLQLDNMYNTRVNVLNMFKQKQEQRKVVIVVDEIENMNNGDKTGITSLIKYLKIKKNKKNDVKIVNPIICIGSTNSEKKIKELMDVCKVIIIENPTNAVITSIFTKYLNNYYTNNINSIIKLVNIAANNLHRVTTIIEYTNKQVTCSDIETDSKENRNTISNFNIMNYFFDSSESTKEIVGKLYKNNFSIYHHKKIISDNDRTIVNLIWHENLPNVLDLKSTSEKINIYKQFLDNICLGDLMDRVIFQNQIWYLGEYSSLIKTFYNNFLLHKVIPYTVLNKGTNKQVDFTKILTKYSTEYNNTTFIMRLCEKLFCDKKDLLWIFMELFKKAQIEKNTDSDINDSDSDSDLAINILDQITNSNDFYNTDFSVNNIYKILNENEISKLDINRIQKLISHIIQEN